jgi:sugar-specific transcriptional regulator TrmB
MNEKVKKFLMDIGLSEKEVLVYLALLPVESSSVIELSSTTKINRTTLYPILEDLMNKSLVSEVKQDKKVRFQAEPPERIETFVHSRKAQLEEQEKVLEDIIPQMRGLVRQTGEKPVVKVYEGREGILKSIEAHYEVANGETEEYLIYPRGAIKELFSAKEQEKARKARLNRKVHMNSIFTSETEYPSDETATRYRVKDLQHKIKSEIGVYADRTRIHIISEHMSAIDIKSKDLADTMKALFELAIKGIQTNQKKPGQ